MSDRVPTSQTGFITTRRKGLKNRTLDESKNPSATSWPSFISAVRFGSRLVLPFSQYLAGRKGPYQGRQKSTVRSSPYCIDGFQRCNPASMNALRLFLQTINPELQTIFPLSLRKKKAAHHFSTRLVHYFF